MFASQIWFNWATLLPTFLNCLAGLKCLNSCKANNKDKWIWHSIWNKSQQRTSLYTWTEGPQAISVYLHSHLFLKLSLPLFILAGFPMLPLIPWGSWKTGEFGGLQVGVLKLSLICICILLTHRVQTIWQGQADCLQQVCRQCGPHAFSTRPAAIWYKGFKTQPGRALGLKAETY